MPLQAKHFVQGFVYGALTGCCVWAIVSRIRPKKHISTHKKDDVDEEDIVNGVEGLIGNTKLVRIKSLSEATGCDILAKAEHLNPGNSAKDRVALFILKDAEERGLLRPKQGDVVFEGTSGSTGISFAMLGRSLGYETRIYMPNDQAQEKSDMLSMLGADVHRVPPAPIMDRKNFVNIARDKAKELTDDVNTPNKGYFANQFENLANWRAHYETTGPEIWRQCAGRVDAFVTGSGTGGTIAGTSRFLKEKNRNILVCLSDPPGSGLYNKIVNGVMFDIREKEGTRRRKQVDTIVEGIGLNRMTRNFSIAEPLIDWAYRITDAQAVQMSRWLVHNDGLFVGSSSALNCVAAVKIAKKLGPGHRIVTIFCDPGHRHSSKLYNDAFLDKEGLPHNLPEDLSFVDAAEEINLPVKR
ncbi:cysteine synthase Cys12 [Schizosaccharomyces japonicus yFS275]|uniref:cysteine synthase n=1 Tax=Schizosaccharomyces japonicus (strain yFS275 / FY16936) TaxID=402676 RepID=B6JZ56_SCHJY|nr:cysteine synthase Cys12 [Schizosaccharomyces japonicus yFS275]EEB06824.1 cysteine synthase Cys12 [Schizosaccharomyces japonicus yFS275]